MTDDPSQSGTPTATDDELLNVRADVDAELRRRGWTDHDIGAVVGDWPDTSGGVRAKKQRKRTGKDSHGAILKELHEHQLSLGYPRRSRGFDYRQAVAVVRPELGSANDFPYAIGDPKR